MNLNERIFFHHLTEEVLPILKPTGLWAAPDPAPLTTAEIRPLLERVAEHPNYDGQKMTTATFDDEVVHLENGEITVEPVAGTPWEGKPQIFPREES